MLYLGIRNHTERTAEAAHENEVNQAAHRREKDSKPAAKPAAAVKATPAAPAAGRGAGAGRGGGGRGGGGRGGGRGGSFPAEGGQDGGQPYRNRQMRGEDGEVSGGAGGIRSGGGGGGGGGGGYGGRGRSGGGSRGGDGERRAPRREFDRHSGTGRGHEMKRDGAGRGNWGRADEVPQTGEQEEAGEEGEAKQANGTAEGEAAAEGDAAAGEAAAEAAPAEEEDKEMTLEEYEKVREEKRKALAASRTAEARKVEVDAEMAAMAVHKKKDVDESDAVFVKLAAVVVVGGVGEDGGDAGGSSSSKQWRLQIRPSSPPSGPLDSSDFSALRCAVIHQQQFGGEDFSKSAHSVSMSTALRQWKMPPPSAALAALLLLISAASLVSCEQRLSYSGFATNEDGVLVAKQSRVTLFKRNSPNAKSSSSNGKSAFAKKQKQAEAEMIAAASKRTKSPKKARSFSSIFGSLVSAPAAQDTPVAAAPSLTIFCSPKPYSSVLDPKDPQPDNQIRALRSWLRLTPSPKIVLLGNDSTFTELARRFPKQVSVESAIDTNYYGLPQFHSIVARAQAADTDLSMIINGDIILLNNVLDAINKVHKTFPHWVMTAARWDVAEDFPYTFFPSMWANARSRGPAALEKEIAEYARTKGSLHTYGGVDFWVWNNSPVQLHTGIMPPFAFGRGKYDNWFTHEIVASGLREVVDASDAVTSIHVAHSYSHVTESAETKNGAAALAGKNFWSTRKKSSWELFANIHLAQTHGSYSNQLGTALHVPWKMSSCFEPAVNNMCLQRRLRPATCQCEYSNFVDISQSDPKIDPSGRRWTCGSVSVDKKSDYSIQAVPTPGSAVGLPHTAAQLLPQVAREVGGLKVVILVAVTMGYAEMLMSFVCRLRGLGLADNLVVAALDEDLYRFAFSQGLAVYHEQVSAQCDPDPPFLGFLSSLLPHVVPHSVSVGYQGLNSKDCVFGSQCFRQFTKLKSRSVLKVLKQGYSVLWTDVDIVWFSDPLPDLLSYGPGTFPIQSNEPNGSIPGTGIRRINSGFYFARSDPKTIEAFEAITAHAATTKLSEQPSFYDILCGVKGENLVAGKEECRWQNGLRTIFLDRKVYPNSCRSTRVINTWRGKPMWNASSFYQASGKTVAVRRKGRWSKRGK
ncbi:unnamed protein product [Closterium sp. NIES-54]